MLADPLELLRLKLLKELLIHDDIIKNQTLHNFIVETINESVTYIRDITTGTRYIQINKDTDRRIFTEWEQLRRGERLTMKETSEIIASRLGDRLEPTTILKYLHRYLKGYNPHQMYMDFADETFCKALDPYIGADNADSI
jgi:hypothetical protein